MIKKTFRSARKRIPQQQIVVQRIIIKFVSAHSFVIIIILFRVFSLYQRCCRSSFDTTYLICRRHRSWQLNFNPVGGRAGGVCFYICHQTVFGRHNEIMTSSKYCLKTRNRMKLPNAKKLDNEQDHDLFLSKFTSALCGDSFNRLPLNSTLGRLPLSELAQELKTGKLISKFEDFDYYTDGEDESPYVYTCSFVLAIMYFERLKVSNPNYLKSINSSELFLISLLVASKYLHDDGELDSAINSEWAVAYGISLKTINQMEKDYLSAMNWEFFISDEEFTNRHKEIVNQLYSDIEKSNSVLLKMFLLISSVVQKIRKLYRRKIVRQKMKHMIAMSTVITVVTATTMQLNHGNQKLVQELYEQIESDPDYPTIPSTHKNDIVKPENVKDISKGWNSSKLLQLLDHLLLMNTCVSDDDRQLSFQTTLSKSNKNQFRNITHFKSIIFFNYLQTINYTY